MRKQRVEVVLTEADEDIMEFMSRSTMPRATQFKVAMRLYMRHQEEERFDIRVKRLLDEVLAERGSVTVTKVETSETRSRLAFGSKVVK